MQNKLLPCPFCGGEAEQDTGERICADESIEEFECVYCTKCRAMIEDDSVEKVVEAWNTRKPMERIIEKMEKEKNYYKKIYEGLPKGNVISERAQAVVETYEGCIEDIKKVV